MQVSLLLIDPQNDFLDKKGTLFNKENSKSAKLLSKFVKENSKIIDNIYVTRQENNLISPYFSYFWKNNLGRQPQIGEKITLFDIEERAWHPVKLTDEFNAEELSYQLQLKKQDELIIEKPKCIVGSWGCLTYQDLHESLHTWSTNTLTPISVISRNNANIFTKDICEYDLYITNIFRNFINICDFGVCLRKCNNNYKELQVLLKNNIETYLIKKQSFLICQNFSS